jgi:DoxX-like family
MSRMRLAQQIAGWVLTVLLSALFLASAGGKLFGAAQVVEMMQKWGLKDQVVLIGAGEAVSALLFLIPRTHSLGLLLLSAYMGGAIVTHMQHGEPYVTQSIILAVIWVAGFLRHPQVLQSFFPTRRIGTGKPATE